MPFLGAQEWASISFPLDDLEQAELVRGPSAALYGANASSGVLNLITKRPRGSEGGQIRLGGGELSTVNADARWAGHLGGQWWGKLLGGLLGKAAGKTVGKVGRAATGMAFSFATTYALGQVAKRYYAGGRRMNTALLQETFQGLLGPAKQLQQQYLPQIEQRAQSLDAGQIMNLVRGG